MSKSKKCGNNCEYCIKMGNAPKKPTKPVQEIVAPAVKGSKDE